MTRLVRMHATSDRDSMATTSEIIWEIQQHIDRNGGIFFNYGWYVGVSSDPGSRLFYGHNVRKDHDAWIWRIAPSSFEAREIERHFLGCGCQGGQGGGDHGAVYVYAYRIETHTKE